MSSRYAVAPPPPAEPGDDPEVGAITHYVAELARWRMRRDHELRALDELTRAHEDRDDLETDLTSSMTLFHAIAQRHDLLLATWQAGDEGGGDPEQADGQRGWVGQLVWGVLETPDGDAQALALPLPDALRLSDAMASSLRGRLGTEQDDLAVQDRLEQADEHADLVGAQLDERAVVPDDDELADRLTAVRESLEELRERDEQDDVMVDLAATLSELVAVEREAIVSRAAHAHAVADRAQVVSERDHLVARGEAVRALAGKVLNAINPAPRLGIPDVEALGEVPQEGPALEAYVGNLERVARALGQAHSTYAAALAEYADLADRAERLAQTLAGCGAPTSVDLAGMLTSTKECLQTQPADIRRAAALIAAQEGYLDMLRTGS